ncbi:CBS domain-containing protein [Celerinatantimonas sp. MCCC 1A17872]
MESILVRDYMLPQPVIFHPHQPLTEVVHELMRHNQIGGPVCDEQLHVVGWISEQDCVRRLLDDTYHCESVSLVDDVMREDVLTVDPQMSIVELAQMITGQKPKMYPVVEQGKLLGIITRREVLKAISAQLDSCFTHKK